MHCPVGDNTYSMLNISNCEADAWCTVHMIVLPQLAKSFNMDTTEFAETTSKPLKKEQ